MDFGRAGVLAAFVALAACDEPREKIPDTPSPVLVNLHVSGPDTLAPGTSGQFTVVAEYADGTSADVTSDAKLSINGTSARAVVSFPAAGIAQASPNSDPGFVNLLAIFNNVRSASRKLFILPPGTFVLQGAITQEGRPDQIGSIIEIVGGTGGAIGSRASRVEAGRYFFFGLAGEVEIRASVSGYAPQAHRLNVTQMTTLDIDLQPLVAPAGVSGAWNMTLMPAASCAGNLPALAVGRVISVQLSQQGANVQAFFSGPTIYNLPSAHLGSVIGNALSLWIDARDVDTHFEAFVFDRLTPTQWIGISGSVTGTVAEPEFSAVLSGAVDLYTAPASANFPPPPPVAGCPGNHALTFRRK